MHRRKIENEHDARACLKKVEESGMERTPWARANGVDARSLPVWWLALERRKKHECGLTRNAVRFVEVVAEPVPARANYWIHVDGMVVEVDDNFQEATLRRLLAAAIMLSLTPSVRVFVAAEPVDMRGSFNANSFTLRFE